MIFMLGDPILKFESQLYFYYILFIFIYTVKNYKYQILFGKYLKKMYIKLLSFYTHYSIVFVRFIYLKKIISS